MGMALGVRCGVSFYQTVPHLSQPFFAHCRAAAGNGHVQYAAGTGYSYGNTSGMAPRARLAIYKVLWKQRNGQTLATYSDIRAAVDAAVADGVDVLSISLGGNIPSYFSDIAYLNAAKAGVFIAMAAGNSGRPNPKRLVGTIGNASPFYLTVGASSISRYYNLQMTLGDGSQITGVGSTPPPIGTNGAVSLIGSGTAPSAGAVLVVGSSASPSGLVSTQKLKRKTPQAGMFATLKEVAAGAGGRPAIVLSVEHGEILRKYLESTDNPSAEITASWTAIDPTAPVIASFSSAGPVVSPRFKIFPPFTPTNNILKPDIIGPGCDLVAAMPGDPASAGSDSAADQSASSDNSLSSSGDSTPTDGSTPPDGSTSGGDTPDSAPINSEPPSTNSGSGASTSASGWGLNPQYPQSRDFTYLSGTSMSTPHIAGVAALIMQRRPHWTPAQVMSALMTTAYTDNGVKKPIKREAVGEATPLDMGAGHINPSRALDPGLTYNTRFRSYLRFLAGQSFIRTKRFFPLVPFIVPMRAYNLNRPSISVTNLVGIAFVTRRATNVYSETSTYKVTVDPPTGVKVSVWPTKFTLRPGQTATYVVTISSLKPVGTFRFGSITWRDEHGHHVRSPVVVRSAFV
ncbi:unnamed protein product [Closterium sp. Yama58-4]|nr:unnamed protein product [Closterium sp. Yama58-4]